MERKFYYAPEVKSHKLRVRLSMLQSTGLADNEGGDGGEGNEGDLSKGFGSFSFYEDED